MENKNPIDEKFVKVSEKFGKASNVISTSKTVYQFLNIIWYLVLLYSIALVIANIFGDSNGPKEAREIVALFSVVSIVVIILIVITTKKIKSMNNPK